MQDNRIKVLQIIGNSSLGGVSSCLLNYLRHIDLNAYRFDFVTYASSPFDKRVREIDPSVKIYYISPFQKNFLKGISQLEKICVKGEYAVAHSHLTTLSAFALTAAAHAGTPVRICHAHSAFNRNSDHFLLKSFLRPFAADHATHLMACSKHAAENIFGKRAGDAFILPDAIESQRFYSDDAQYQQARAELKLNGKIVLFVGRYAYQKNIPFLVEAFSEAAKDKDIKLVLLGDGEQKKEIIEAVKKCGVTEKVMLVPPCDPAPWYKAADLFCMPSRYEGLGMAAIEAQAAGLKCLLSKAVPSEADITGNCKFLNADINEWAQAIKDTDGKNYAVQEKFIAAGYDIQGQAHKLTDFYRRAIEGAK